MNHVKAIIDAQDKTTVVNPRKPSWGESKPDDFFPVVGLGAFLAAIAALASVIFSMLVFAPFIGTGHELDPYMLWTAITFASATFVGTMLHLYVLPKFAWPAEKYPTTRHAGVAAAYRTLSDSAQEQLRPIYTAIQASPEGSPKLNELTQMFIESSGLILKSEKDNAVRAAEPQIEEATHAYRAIREIYGRD